MIRSSEDHDHSESLLDGILEITFGLEHVVAEFFWNGIFVLATYLITKATALRKIHKYVDSRHGVEHPDGKY